MKTFVRAFSVTLLVTGLAFASHSSSHQLAVRHQAVSVGVPGPACNPGVPDGCSMGPSGK